MFPSFDIQFHIWLNILYKRIVYIVKLKQNENTSHAKIIWRIRTHLETVLERPKDCE